MAGRKRTYGSRINPLRPGLRRFKRLRTYARSAPRRFRPRAGVARSISRSPGFPMLLRMKHVSIFNVELPLGDVNAPTRIFIHANGLTDVLVGGSAPVPSNVTLMRTIYNHYRVVGSKITFILNQSQSTRTDAWSGNFVTYIDDNASNNRGCDQLAMIPGSRQKIVAFPARGQTTMVRKWSMKKTFGKDAPIASLQALGTSNPSEGSYFLLAAGRQEPANSPSPAIISCQIRVQYTAIWSERQEIIL